MSGDRSFMDFLDALVFCDMLGALPRGESERRAFLRKFLRRNDADPVTPELARVAALYLLAKGRLEQLPEDATDNVRIAALAELAASLSGELPA